MQGVSANCIVGPACMQLYMESHMDLFVEMVSVEVKAVLAAC